MAQQHSIRVPLSGQRHAEPARPVARVPLDQRRVFRARQFGAPWPAPDATAGRRTRCARLHHADGAPAARGCPHSSASGSRQARRPRSERSITRGMPWLMTTVRPPTSQSRASSPKQRRRAPRQDMRRNSRARVRPPGCRRKDPSTAVPIAQACEDQQQRAQGCSFRAPDHERGSSRARLCASRAPERSASSRPAGSGSAASRGAVDERRPRHHAAPPRGMRRPKSRPARGSEPRTAGGVLYELHHGSYPPRLACPRPFGMADVKSQPSVGSTPTARVNRMVAGTEAGFCRRHERAEASKHLEEHA